MTTIRNGHHANMQQWRDASTMRASKMRSDAKKRCPL
jgi:tRNA G37 N-methylase TrmD